MNAFINRSHDDYETICVVVHHLTNMKECEDVIKWASCLESYDHGSIYPVFDRFNVNVYVGYQQDAATILLKYA